MAVGYLKIKHKDIKTGEMVSVYDDFQVITTSGLQGIVHRFSRSQPADDDSYINGIRLGDDFGEFGTAIIPEQPTPVYNSASQNVVYQINEIDIVKTHPDSNSVRLYFNKTGTDILTEEQPESGSIAYSSATLRLNNGIVFAVERFPSVSISNGIEIEITWTITFGEDV